MPKTTSKNQKPKDSKPPEQTLLFIKPKKTEEEVVPPVDPAKEEKLMKTPSPLPYPIKPFIKPVERNLEPDPSFTGISPEAPADAQFKAVGIVVGNVTYNGTAATIAIGSYEYPLYYAPAFRTAYEALKLQVKRHPGELERLLVYPRIIHLPGRDIQHIVGFQLVRFQGRQQDAASFSEFQDLDFHISGLWQFLPTCVIPCVTVLKNFSEERLEKVKNSDVIRNVKYLKATHVPIIWKNPSVRPFKFNPKLEKEQRGSANYIEILARFIPGRDVFGFVKLLSQPSQKSPRFLKIRKQDKLKAIKMQQAQQTGKRIGKLMKPKKSPEQK